MNVIDEALAELLAVKGVRSAALVAGDGSVLTRAGTADDTGLPLSGALASALAVRSLFDRFLGSGGVGGVTIDYPRGPVVITPMHYEGEELVLMTRIASLADLGRARLAIRKALPRLANVRS